MPCVTLITDAVCLHLATSSLHWEFSSLLFARCTQGHSFALLSYGLSALFCMLAFAIFCVPLRSFVPFCIRPRLEGPFSGVAHHNWRSLLTTVFGSFLIAMDFLLAIGEFYAYNGKVCLRTSTDYKQICSKPLKWFNILSFAGFSDFLFFLRRGGGTLGFRAWIIYTFRIFRRLFCSGHLKEPGF